jgi:putative FmdB family regulatory protein
MPPDLLACASIRIYGLTSLDCASTPSGIKYKESRIFEGNVTMPTYQYACIACDHVFEAVQSFSEDALTICPECNGEIRKVYSSVGVVFKGSGFYKTDSAKPAPTTSSE